MNYTDILIYMRHEVTLMAIIIVLFIYDLAAGKRGRSRFSAVASCLLLVQVAVNIVPIHQSAELFGGMFVYAPVHSVIKSILAIGALIVCLQADTWLRRDDTEFKRGEYYILTLSTLLGMYFMIGAGNFLLFFIGLELASIPMACLVAFDKYKHYSAEAGAKYILTALFSSGLMLYGISFLYGTTGTLYFDDMPARIDGSALQILAMVFFFSGLGFKLSLVPFHLWTADSYQGAPTPVTGYLSVVSKGAAAFTLMVIMMKVFGPMISQWQTMLEIIIVLSITVANLFATASERPEAFPRLLVHLAGRIYHAGRHRRQSRGHDIAHILHSGLYGRQPRSLRRHLDRRAAHRRQGLDAGLQRILPHKPQTGRGDDARALLAGGNTSLCGILLEVLHLLGRIPRGLPRR